MAWSAEQDAVLIPLVRAGESYSVVASRMRHIKPDITRDAVSGRVMRLRAKGVTLPMATPPSPPTPKALAKAALPLPPPKTKAETFWPPEKVALAAKLWAEGYYTTQICHRLGVSHSAIVRLKRREGWPDRPRPNPPLPRAEPRFRLEIPRAPRPVLKGPTMARFATPAPEDRPTIEHLGPCMCKFYIGDVERGMMDQQRFCGADTGDVTVVYCREHRLVAYNPAPPRRQRAA